MKRILTVLLEFAVFAFFLLVLLACMAVGR